MPTRRIRRDQRKKIKGVKREQPQKRNKNEKFYNSKAWRNLRANYIQRNPICVMCKAQGKLTPGDHIDHIRPIEQGGAALDESNLQTLCISCHARKTLKERR